MTTRSAVLAPAVAGASGALSIVTLVLAWRNGSDLTTFVAGNHANNWVAGLAFGMVAALVLRDRPDNRLGPILAVAALLLAACAAADEYATQALRTAPGSLPAADLAAWCAAVLWMPGFLLLLTGLPLLFPDGRLPSARWRYPARIALVAGTVAVVCAATTEYVIHDAFPEATNPIDLPVPDGPQVAVAAGAFFVALGVGAAAIIAAVLRMRRLGPPERQRYAWFVTGVALILVVSEVPLPDLVIFAAHIVAIVAFGIGIVRHQLFDIELVLSRAVVYAVLTAGAMAAYLLAVILVGAGFDAGAGPALAAAAAALLLATARQRIQHGVDRLLYGERRDPLEVLTGLGERLGPVPAVPHCGALRACPMSTA